MAELRRRHGPPPPRLRPQPPSRALVASIVSQQISGKAASIVATLEARVPPEPAAPLRAHPLRLRAARLSRAKAQMFLLQALGDRFRPWRSHAARSLWRALDG
jgi:3-methyladenine DNA glycosylase/8-oxoguanine DNA glycosylase